MWSLQVAGCAGPTEEAAFAWAPCHPAGSDGRSCRGIVSLGPLHLTGGLRLSPGAVQSQISKFKFFLRRLKRKPQRPSGLAHEAGVPHLPPHLHFLQASPVGMPARPRNQATPCRSCPPPCQPACCSAGGLTACPGGCGRGGDLVHQAKGSRAPDCLAAFEISEE